MGPDSPGDRRAPLLPRIAVAVAVAVAVLAPGGAAPASASAPLPTSMAVVGDSFSLGFATGIDGCTVACPAQSWSAGTALSSHYQRLIGLSPAIAGQVTNAAVPGATMSQFATQVGTFSAGRPSYVTVLLGAGDLCFASTSVPDFTTQFRAGLDALFTASPESRVLVASIWNLESQRTAVLAADPSATFGLCNGFFAGDDPTRAAIMDRLRAYNAVFANECATYPNCRFDGGALYEHVWTRDEISTIDNLHPSLVGQAMISAVEWAAGFWVSTPEPTFTG